jgi:hypothetical protein
VGNDEDGPGDSTVPPIAEPGNTPIKVVGGTLLPKDVTVAQAVNSELSFTQAFAEAREDVGMGGLFVWNGNIYNTFLKEEWQGLSLQQRQDFLADVGYEPVVETHLSGNQNTADGTQKSSEPITIEGYVNGQRVMGLDFDHDGVIDTLVFDGRDGYTYRVVDATGNDGLDTVYQFDSFSHDIVQSAKLEEPFLLTNTLFEQGLEQAMANVEDSYVNNADVSDMDES